MIREKSWLGQVKKILENEVEVMFQERFFEISETPKNMERKSIIASRRNSLKLTSSHCLCSIREPINELTDKLIQKTISMYIIF